MVDDAGNVVVSNLVLNITTTPLCIHQVNLSTGAVTQRAALTLTTSQVTDANHRVDHCGIVGNVASGNFTVFATFSSGTQLARWTVTNGTVTETKVVNLQAFSPSTATSVGTASRVIPLSTSQVIIGGGNIWPTRYDFSTGAITGSFDAVPGAQPASLRSNGAAAFTLGGTSYLLYPYNDYSNKTSQWALAQNATGSTDFSGFERMYTFPTQGMGAVNSTTCDYVCATRPGSTAGTQLLYVYAPGNGLAAYKLTATSLIGDLNADGKVDVGDVTDLVGIILTDGSNAKADLNADGKIDASDVTALVGIILSHQ